jgi:hypothetical protein
MPQEDITNTPMDLFFSLEPYFPQQKTDMKLGPDSPMT